MLLGYSTLNGSTSLGYTGAGNIASITPPTGTPTSLHYNQAERLASVNVGGKLNAGFAYDGFGRRFSKTSPTAQSVLQYDPSGRLLEETDGSGSARTDTLYLNGTPIADITPASGALYFLHTDRLGTPQIATTTQKAVAWRSAYQPFGTNSGTRALFTQNLRLPGQYADTETGWYQNGFRDYVPGWGRYLESDPIGLAVGVNTFAYVRQNPLSLTDRLGLYPGELFPTPGAAAYDVLAYVNPLSVAENVEYAGVIRVDPATGNYYATFPNSGTSTSAIVGCHPEGDDVGLYHTHGNYSIEDPDTGLPIPTSDPLQDQYNSNQFSETDIEIIDYLSQRRVGFTGYLGTPSGTFLQYSPLQGSPSVLQPFH